MALNNSGWRPATLSESRLPKIRDQLAEAASAIIREEARAAQEPAQPDRRQSVNPLAAGLGLDFLWPPVGLVLLVHESRSTFLAWKLLCKIIR